MTTKNDRNVILVTGAAGNVGTALVKQLSTAGAIFRAGVHSNKSTDEIGKISSRAQLARKLIM